MATKRKKAKKKAAVKTKVFNLKSFRGDIQKLKKALKKASRSKVALIVRNAPFKHCPA
jgi:hypothetical protein